jgi:membrane dipeptidase
VLAALPANGGVCMVTFVPRFVSPREEATVADVVAHVEHAREVAGVDHIGLGSDYDGVAAFPEGMGDVTGHAVLLDRLAERGWSSLDLAKLMGDNILRVLDTTTGAS